ncbi:MAG: 2-amino-4-hydroxy-6-hydroxymethyldihydropteridine diphosphokinase [Bacteroidales bacterium]|nr:2-amino-4-hydroxy-6-hydroxymethyldihydropteridine diphosphokinase [Bacteroidales bacterium]
MQTAVLSLGSNWADRSRYLERAAELLSERVGRLLHCSSVKETEAWGFDGPPFLNQVLEMETQLSPKQLLEVTRQIERELGRTEKSTRDASGHPVYHNRTIDIDILLYGNLALQSEELTIPHPQIDQRTFVLDLLVELFGNHVITPFDRSFQSMLQQLNIKKSQENEV